MSFLNKVQGSFGVAAHTVQEHSPDILLAVGLIGTLATVIVACKETPKAVEIVEESKYQMDCINECASDPEKYGYDEETENRDKIVVASSTTVKLVKNYIPAIIIGTLSTAAIIASHTILKQRNAQILAAFSTVSAAYAAYRGRVKERFGDEVEREIHYDIKATEFDKKETEDGKTEYVATKKSSGYNQYSDYAKFFDESNENWTKDPEYNLNFLKSQQRYFEGLLKRRAAQYGKGYVTLNEVYVRLGLPKTAAGQFVGWIYDPSGECKYGEHSYGDNYIDFGIYNSETRATAFVNGYERSILLDFNVDDGGEFIYEMETICAGKYMFR